MSNGKNKKENDQLLRVPNHLEGRGMVTEGGRLGAEDQERTKISEA